ncbi:MBL fold metallo-hydrolase [Thermoproteota archaeon]
MDLKFHGGAKEVGRSCIEVITGAKNRYILDAGIKLSEHGTEYPTAVSEPENIKAAFISHAHLDHTGYLPALDNQGMKCPIFCTPATKATSRMLLRDAFKIGRLKHEHLGYQEQNIAKTMDWMRKIRVHEKGSVSDVNFELMSAGHIPGSVSVLLETKEREKKRLFYTGDINTTDTRLLKKAEISYRDIGEIDMLITEATYGNRDHPNREKQEKEFIDSVTSTVDNGGSVIIPVFAEGRAQEILLLMNRAKIAGVPIYLDGMSREATRIILQFPKSTRDSKKLNSAFRKVKQVKGRIQRNKIVQDQGIFITTSGMLTGGPVITYLDALCQDKHNSILLTGYQADHTNGRMLLEQGIVFIDGWKTKVNSYVKHFDFSAHSGRIQLKEMIKKINPHSIAIQHGDSKACASLAEWADVMGFKAHVPDINERIRV